MLLAGSPGETTSNLIVHVTDGDPALSVSLTALSNAVVFLLLPFELRTTGRTLQADGPA